MVLLRYLVGLRVRAGNDRDSCFHKLISINRNVSTQLGLAPETSLCVLLPRLPILSSVCFIFFLYIFRLGGTTLLFAVNNVPLSGFERAVALDGRQRPDVPLSHTSVFPEVTGPLLSYRPGGRGSGGLGDEYWGRLGKRCAGGLRSRTHAVRSRI